MRRCVVLIAALSVLLLGCLDPTTGRPPPAGQPAPPYVSSVSALTTRELGTSWRSGCPVGAADLRRVRVTYWGYDGAVHTGDLVVHRVEAVDVAAAFGRMYADRFQIRRIHPVTVYGSSDDRSMEANNTSAFNCRRVAGSTSWSEHAYGRAIDINPVQNPYVTRSGAIVPESGRPWADRSLRVPGMIHAGGPVTRAFGAIGWVWGGTWTYSKDYQHLSSTGR